jgi:hypothetical protein
MQIHVSVSSVPEVLQILNKTRNRTQRAEYEDSTAKRE